MSSTTPVPATVSEPEGREPPPLPVKKKKKKTKDSPKACRKCGCTQFVTSVKETHPPKYIKVCNNCLNPRY